MSQIELHYDMGALLQARRGQPLLRDAGPSPNLRVHNEQLALLRAVSATGSIASAAARLNLSYRHVWGALKTFELQSACSLIEWSRGKSARLTDTGQRLLYADALAQARMAPHIAALTAELERSIGLAFAPDSRIVSMHASHDEALWVLREHLAGLAGNPALHLDVQFGGSVDAIRALNEGRCLIAGFHTVLNASAKSLTAKTYKPLLTPGVHKVMGFVRRTQGLGVAAGNPHRIKGLADVSQRGLRLINRAIGTGTRVLLDELLAQLRIGKRQVTGYRSSEASHHGAAQAVAQGRADCGLMIEHVAQRHGLGFVPLVQERFDWVCHKSALKLPAVKQLQRVLQSEAWLDKLRGLSGYAPDPHSGQVLPMTQVLPWWTFAD